VIWADGQLQHTPALSGAANTPGTTYLLTGADTRDGGIADDGAEGSRTDTIMVLQVPPSGPAALISIPRDTYVADIPGHGPGKLNAAFAYGGAPLLVQVVESLTGLTIDHYAEIGMGGVVNLVDAVGGVELCYDSDVSDPESGMQWTAGCHVVAGQEALAFARMRKSDPKGDIGRAERQRQLIHAVTSSVNLREVALHPSQQKALISAGAAAITVDEDAGALDVARLALAFKSAQGPDGITGTPPIANLDYRPGDVGSTVLLDPDAAPAFWQGITNGTLPAGTVGGIQ
jgi:LCP family protein required for cell wall assembly